MRIPASIDRSRAGTICCGLLVLALGACAQNPRPSVRPQLVQSLSADQQIEDIVGALKAGDTRRARKLLKTVSRRSAADNRIISLREGLDGNPAKLLGGRSFEYRVEGREDLTMLAQRFLGSRFKFYLLARYNGLDRDALRPGQMLKIPGIAPPPRPRPDPKPASRPEDRPDVRSAPRAGPGIPVNRPTAPVTRPQPPQQSSQSANPAAAARLRAQGLAALGRGSVASAVALLQRAHALNPANVPIRNDLARAERLYAAVKARR